MWYTQNSFESIAVMKNFFHHEKEKRKNWFYPEPDMTISMLKLVMPDMLLDVVRVNTAVATLPAGNTVPSTFHLSAIGPLAVVGFQFVSDKLSETWALPIFFTYTVRVTEPPGATLPQFMDVRG
jgi:hypothetical protein